MDSIQSIHVEIFQMSSVKNAKNLFADTRTEQGKAIAIGQAGVLQGYSCMFRQGAYVVTVTGSEPTKIITRLIKRMAKAMARTIQRKSK